MTEIIESNTAGTTAAPGIPCAAPCYTVLDLFSGIGGFSLGLEKTGGFRTIAFCEYEEHAQKILRKHWPDVPIFKDVRELHAKDLPEPADVICGGFPCQDLSSLGKKKGFSGDRSSLYTEMLRIIGECGPQYAIFENVTNLIMGEQGRWFAQFLYDLAEIGLDAEWHCIPAAIIGADHERDRVWIIAYPQKNRNSQFQKPHRGTDCPRQERAIFADKLFDILRGWRPLHGRADSKPGICRIVDGFPGGMDRLARLGNAVVPQIPELIGRAILASV